MGLQNHGRIAVGKADVDGQTESLPLQDLLPPQVPDSVEESANRAELPEAPVVVALQDLLNRHYWRA